MAADVDATAKDAAGPPTVRDAPGTTTTPVADLSKLQHTVGRYMLFGSVGSGGMGTVHLGRRVGAAGFSRLVAIKRMHPHLGQEKQFVHAFLDEARIAARINHPNVVSIDDVVMDGDEVLLVMEYVHGRSLAFLSVAERGRGRSVPPPIAVTIALDILHGLQAAHDARDERGDPLHVIHRDVSPQNILVGADGVARILDFGIAKALGRLQKTETGAVKGKLAYMAPECLSEDIPLTTTIDVYGAAVVIWEMLAGERFMTASTTSAQISALMQSSYRHLRNDALAEIDAVIERAMKRDPSERFESCRDFGEAIEAAIKPASRGDVVAWVESVAGPELAESEDLIAEIEQRSMPFPPPASDRISEKSQQTSQQRTSERSLTPTAIRPANDTDAYADTMLATAAGLPHSSPVRYIAIGVGLIALVVIAFVAWPTKGNPAPTAPEVTVVETAGAPASTPIAASRIIPAPETPTAMASTAAPMIPIASSRAQRIITGHTPKSMPTTAPVQTSEKATPSAAKRPDDEAPADRH